MPLPNTFGAASARGFGGFNFQTPRDPNFSSVSLLLPGNGTNGAQNNTFLDSSTNAFTITRNGNTTQGTFSPFPPSAGSAWSAATNGGSGYFDGSGDYLTAPSNAAFNISTGDYTFECWVYKQTSSRVMLVSVASAGLSIAINASGNIEVCRSLTAIDFTFTAGVTNNQWTHIAVSRSGTSLRAFMNGVLLGTQTSSTSYGQGICYIGIDADGASTPYFGYITDARLVKGTAVYTSTFTPPTAPLTAITNTSLLLNFTNGAIYDAAAKNDLETVGNAQISTAQSKWGGSSMYFDGSGDYGAVADNAALEMGSGNFTIEGWIYTNTVAAGLATVLTKSNGTASAFSPYLIGRSGSSLIVRMSSSGGSWDIANAVSFGTLTAATWAHFALVRNGTNFTGYFNGVGTTVATSSAALWDNAFALTVAALNGASITEFWDGYLQDLRITKGVARYTSNFTPPTAPFPVR